MGLRLSRFDSVGNTYVYKAAYTGPYYFPLCDGVGTSLVPDSLLFGSTYVTFILPYSSRGDNMQSDAGDGLVRLARYEGADVSIAHQQLYSDSGLTFSGVVCSTTGKLVGSYAKYTIPASVPATHTTAAVLLARPRNCCKVKAVYVDVTTAFNQAGSKVSIGKVVPTGGSTTVNAYIVASDITTTAQYGLASGDLGADLLGAVQGGALLWGDTTVTNDIIAVFSGAGLASLTLGSLDIYIEFENLY